MQVLTGQYPTLYTHKFTFDFTDFKSGTLKYAVLDFLTIPKGQQVVSMACKQLVTFNGVNMGTPTLRVFQKNIMPAYPSGKGALMAVTVNQTVSLQQGYITQQINRTYPNASTPPNVWCNYLSPTTLTARVEISGTGNMSGLTAGSFWVWVTVMGFK